MTALIGIVSAFAMILTATWIGGTPAAFVNSAGILIVIFGTFAVTAISFTAEELVEAPRTVWRILTQPVVDPAHAAVMVIRLSERARKDGLLALENTIRQLSQNPFLAKAVQLVVDGAPPDEVERIMKHEATTIASRHMRAVDVLRRAGEVAPAMGLIGTLIGLVQMLGTLDDPSTIGPAMAVALLTTFYGAIMAHLVFIPLAARAERSSSEEGMLNTLFAMGAASIGRKENPRRLEMLLNTILPPAKKVSYFN